MSGVVLVVDDDKDFAVLLARYLESNSFRVLKAFKAKDALSVLSKNKVDLVISDVEMPGMSGVELVKSIRDSQKTADLPIILMSGKKISEIDMIEGYTRGSDDYIVKPFSMPVLFAKMKNIIQRSKPRRKNDAIKIENVLISPSKRQVVRGDNEIPLTRKEFDLLLTLVKGKGRIFSHNDLLDLVWGYDPARYNNPHTVESHISSLRKKLGEKLSGKIKSVTGHGYKFDL